MFTIKNIGDEPFAIGGCPLLQKGEIAEVSDYIVEMVRNNPNIEILPSKVTWVESEPTAKSKTVRGVE